MYITTSRLGECQRQEALLEVEGGDAFLEKFCEKCIKSAF